MVCRVCASEKPPEQMKRKPGGRAFICKRCDADRAMVYHHAHRVERLAYLRTYRLRPAALARDKARDIKRRANADFMENERVRHRLNRQLESTKAYSRAYQRAYAALNRLRSSAHSAVKAAVKGGELVKPSQCGACGDARMRLHAHHDTYERPLSVVWLCPKCHTAVHKKERKVA